MSLLAALGGEPDGLICSRAGCSASARVMIRWRNPRIHAEDRVKTWLACSEHEAFLTRFLREREFPVATEPITVNEVNAAHDECAADRAASPLGGTSAT